jgi:hypothetical protein
MEPERFGIAFRHYEVDHLHFEANFGMNLSKDNLSENQGEGYTEYILKLEPTKEFKGSERGLTMGVGYFDFSMVVKRPLSANIEDLVKEGKPFGRIYFEKEGRGKKARYFWYYQHEVEIPKESESGLVPFLNDRIIDVAPKILLEPEKPIDLKLRLKKFSEMKTTKLATIEAV